MQKRKGYTIFAIALCEICGIYQPLTNERSASLDGGHKVSNHARSKHKGISEGIRWTNIDKEMLQTMRSPSFKEGSL